MAELHHIVGSLLRDISQARMVSDIYSRNISNYYEQDPLLRRFPTPRAEIDEVEIDLKFILEGMISNPSQNESRETSCVSLFTNYSFAVTENFFSILITESKPVHNKMTEENRDRLISNDPKQASGWAQFEYRIYVKQSLVLLFQRNRDRFIVNGTLQEVVVYAEVRKILEDWANTLLDDPNLKKTEIRSIRSKTLKVLDLKKSIKEMAKPILEVESGDGDLKLDIDVTLAKLMEAPEAAISSIKIKSKVRNYVWSKIEHEGQTQRRLNPE